MICLSWNCQGLGNPRAVHALRELIHSRKLDVIFLIETLVHIGFVGAFAVDREGRGGGISFLWKAPNMCSLLHYSNNHINVQVCDDEKGPWRLTSFYSYPDRNRRRDSWNLLRAICDSSRLPWCCIGDFNDMLSPEDKQGRLDHPNWLLLQNLVAPVSDHNPILLETVSVSRPGLNKMVEDAWSLSRMGDVSSRLDQCGRALAKWAVIERLRDINIPSDIETVKEKKIELLKLLGQEEDYWRQHSKSFWLHDGDANTKYFHVTASTRKRTNRISRLMDDRVIGMMIRVVFLFSLSSSHVIDGFDFVDCKVSDLDNEKLLSPFSFEEFKEAVFQMHPDKSLGLDGLNPTFYQKFWPLIGKDIFQVVVSWLYREEFPASLNDTTIVLIPKCESPKTMKDLRPISLCNVLYKIVSKVLANRLKVLLPNIISNAQSAFVPGRAITDNVLVAFELIHFMRRKRKGKVGEVALKIDISKAYDRNLGFSDKWIRLIMLCVTTISYSMAFNGMEFGPIIPGKGLRQGDPLSPYLFILCAEGLSALIWEKLCVRKEEGGMGFRDMQSFNLAMLAKQGWNILSNPDALVCCVFKAKYFPKGDFLAAQCGHNPSYTWKIIWHSRIVLEKGCRWRIGNGQHIRVWDDLWLKEMDNFKVVLPRVEGLEDIRLGMVINLNHQGDGNWHAPPTSSFKCNVDAASFTSSNLTGFGIVIHDELGAFVKGYTSTVLGLLVSKEGEAMALIAAIKWVTSMDIQNVVFEIDALVVWKALRAPASDLFEFGSLVHECSSLLQQGVNFLVAYVERQANTVAHSLARASCHFQEFLPHHRMVTSRQLQALRLGWQACNCHCWILIS
uniref:Reverse transcriptase domain-containing protein n=1 Tax=Nelumbo nucifera TaxID=4432 RepID=A0A822XW49_NELNU|nr:TPA_asm: hypothetical protein HUJ06_025685 [Nelumbo nucifera]